MKQLKYLLISLIFISANTGCAQKVFTDAEQQQISIQTPGIFQKSNDVIVDLSSVGDNDYSFPLPVGKAQVINGQSLEIETSKGDAVKAMLAGTVRLSRHVQGFGNVIVIRHDNGLETVYGNNAENLVTVGQKVRAGQTVAIVGTDAGRTYCLFAIMINGARINPATILEPKSHRLISQKLLFRKNGRGVGVKVLKDEAQEKAKETHPNVLDLSRISVNDYAYPLPCCHVISPYGSRGGRMHTGVDLKTKPNDNILAAFDGVVTQSCPYYGYGNFIVIRHDNGLETRYSHQSKNFVKAGQRVKAGQVIGLTGRTGRATTEHLHFEVLFRGKRIDPAMVFNHATKLIRTHKLVLRGGSVRAEK